MKEPLPYILEPAGSVARPARETPYIVIGDDDIARVDLRQYWRIIRKHLWLALAVPLVFVMLTATHDLMATRLYTARATILIKNNAPQIYEYTSMDSAPGAGETGAAQWSINNKTEYALLESRNLTNRVILAEGLFANPLFAGARPNGALAGGGEDSGDEAAFGSEFNELAPDWLISRYLADLKVTPLDETELVAVSFTTPDPALSARVANAHVREFIRQGVELNSQASEQAAQFLEKKLAELKRGVEESELALNSYRRDKGIIPGLISVNGNEDVVLGRLDKLSDRVQQAHLANLNLETQIALVKQGHADALPAVIDSKIVQGLRENLDTLQAQYASMSGEYKPDYLPMAELTAKINGTRDALKREITSIVASIENQYAASLEDEDALNQELKHEKEFALGLNDAAVKYAILQREADTNKQLYNAVLTRMKDVEVTADLHASNISIVDRATPPPAPSSPRLVRDLLAAGLLGLMGGVGLTFLLERHDDTFKDAKEIESYLRVPRLGTIPGFQQFAGITTGTGGALRQVPTRASASLSYENHSPVGEAYRMLRTALLLSRAGAPPKIALVSSAIPGEGKTTTAANLSIVLAGTNKKVLLIDADLRRPSCHRVFGLPNCFGLAEALTGVSEVEELIRPTEIKNVYLLTSGTVPPDPSELLGSDKMREILDNLRGQFDCIIVDTAPIILVTDAVILSSMVDGVLMVAHKRTARQQVKAALARLEFVQARIFGVVLNGVDLNSFGYDGYTSHYYTNGYGPNNASRGDTAGK
ncbi:MAG: polysaccharide biosynthesis tyrosine autokinase [Candidatus Binataceae bacterium]|nr:polysaccharide biosynthesis tyrosine autokinase [Candidatus Binataceae bacterium]